MRLYAIVGPDDKTGPIAEELRILPTDSAETIERKAVDIKERLNRERGHRGTIGVRVDDTLRCEHRYRWQALLAVRRYGRKFDHFSPTGDCVNFITVLIDGERVTVRENPWDYKRESRKWDIRNRIYSLLHPYSPEERILYRIRHAFRYKRRLSRKYGLHIYSSRNRQFPYFVREYDECMTEKEIARAVLYYGFSLLEDRRNALREDDSNAIYLLRDDAITYVVTYILPGNGRLRDIIYRRLLQTPSTDDGGPKNVLAVVDTILGFMREYFQDTL